MFSLKDFISTKLNKGANKKVSIPKNLFTNLKIPILILDPIWLEQFPKDQKTEKIIYWEEKIKELMKENARLTEIQKNSMQSKRNSMSQILQLTPAVHEQNDAEAKMKMDMQQQVIHQANATLEEIEHRLQKIPEEIIKANNELLEETVLVCYQLMKDSQERLDVILPEEAYLRERLKTIVEEKNVLEEYSKKTYNLLHNLVGSEIIEFLDRYHLRG